MQLSTHSIVCILFRHICLLSICISRELLGKTIGKVERLREIGIGFCDDTEIFLFKTFAGIFGKCDKCFHGFALIKEGR